MDIDKVGLFSAMKRRLGWLTQRQEVLAQNIANADTPKYRAHDLKAYDFKEILDQEKRQINMTVTGEGHLEGRRKRIRDFAEQEIRQPFETSPTGNSVVLEEQMANVNETQTKHRLTTELYRKHLNMLKLAVRSSGGS